MVIKTGKIRKGSCFSSLQTKFVFTLTLASSCNVPRVLRAGKQTVNIHKLNSLQTRSV